MVCTATPPKSRIVFSTAIAAAASMRTPSAAQNRCNRRDMRQPIYQRLRKLCQPIPPAALGQRDCGASGPRLGLMLGSAGDALEENPPPLRRRGLPILLLRRPLLVQ